MGSQTLPRIVITAGDPAGIGPDIVADALDRDYAAAIAVLGDPGVIADRARQIGKAVTVSECDRGEFLPHRPGNIRVTPVSVSSPVSAGRLDPANAAAVIATIDTATDLCLAGDADAMVTAPVHKAVINDAGIAFRGHTEWIAERVGNALPVMMLAGPKLRVCLATTHLPLSAVPGAINAELLSRILEIMDRDIGRLYGIGRPRIGVLGLNPHAGEGGYLGREEIEIITPTLESLRSEGMCLTGPLPADTAFTPGVLDELDAVLAMYHDQGLPVIKHQGFGDVVNVTLGLPLIRTSVDHGTALELAGTGEASADSMVAAIELAIAFARNAAPANQAGQ